MINFHFFVEMIKNYKLQSLYYFPNCLSGKRAIIKLMLMNRLCVNKFTYNKLSRHEIWNFTTKSFSEGAPIVRKTIGRDVCISLSINIECDCLLDLCYGRRRKSLHHTVWSHFQRADLDSNGKVSQGELILYLEDSSTHRK